MKASILRNFIDLSPDEWINAWSEAIIGRKVFGDLVKDKGLFSKVRNDFRKNFRKCYGKGIALPTGEGGFKIIDGIAPATFGVRKEKQEEAMSLCMAKVMLDTLEDYGWIDREKFLKKTSLEEIAKKMDEIYKKMVEKIEKKY